MTTPSESEVDIFELRNHRGVYRLNQMVIELNPSVRLFARDGTANPHATPEDLGVLIHEYVHYIHNYGTLSGVMLVALHAKLAAHLSTTLLLGMPYLSSGGLLAPALGSADPSGFRKTLDLLTAFMGDGALPLRGADRFRFEKGVIEFSENGRVARIPVKSWRSKCGFADNGRLTVGFRAIEESIAYELQRLATVKMGGREPEPPHYPYLTLRKMRDHICSKASLSSVLRVALLALNSANAMKYLVDGLATLGRYPRRRHRGIIHEMLPSWRAEERTSQITALTQVLRHAYASRGALELAADILARTIQANMKRRLEVPFFELEAVEAGTEAVTRLLAELLPCEIVQQFDDGTGVMVTVGDDDQNPDEEVWARRAMQSHIRFLETHRISGGFRSSLEVARVFEIDGNHHCPYFSICDLRPRAETPNTCSSRPWEYALLKSEERCWHAEGIAATFVTFIGKPRRGGSNASLEPLAK